MGENQFNTKFQQGFKLFKTGFPGLYCISISLKRIKIKQNLSILLGGK